MTTPPMQPPWEFLLSASKISLQSFELSRLNHAANLKKEIAALLDQWLEENAEAMLARWLIWHSESGARQPQLSSPSESEKDPALSASDNLFANRNAFRRATGSRA